MPHKTLTSSTALPGRDTALALDPIHHVNGHTMLPPYPEKMQSIVLGLGCFWGAERAFWTLPGVYVTAVGYAGGVTPNPTYEEVCTGKTGHAEVVKIVFDPAHISLAQILKQFWEVHDPTQGMRQGNDIGTQYRSIILVANEQQRDVVQCSAQHYQQRLQAAGKGTLTTVIEPLTHFYYAETYHQQYLSKHPDGYCGLKGTGVSCALS